MDPARFIPSGSTILVPGVPLKSIQVSAALTAETCIGIVAPFEFVMLTGVLPVAAKFAGLEYVPTEAVTSPEPVIIAVAVVFSEIAGKTMLYCKYSCEAPSIPAAPTVAPATSYVNPCPLGKNTFVVPETVHLNVAVLLEATSYGLIVYAVLTDVFVGVVKAPLAGVAQVNWGNIVADPLIPKELLVAVAATVIGKPATTLPLLKLKLKGTILVPAPIPE